MPSTSHTGSELTLPRRISTIDFRDNGVIYLSQHWIWEVSLDSRTSRPTSLVFVAKSLANESAPIRIDPFKYCWIGILQVVLEFLPECHRITNSCCIRSYFNSHFLVTLK